MKCIEKALDFCDGQDQDLDEEQEKLVKRRKLVKEQRDILEGAKMYIISSGTIEERSLNSRRSRRLARNQH